MNRGQFSQISFLCQKSWQRASQTALCSTIWMFTEFDPPSSMMMGRNASHTQAGVAFCDPVIIPSRTPDFPVVWQDDNNRTETATIIASDLTGFFLTPILSLIIQSSHRTVLLPCAAPGLESLEQKGMHPFALYAASDFFSLLLFLPLGKIQKNRTQGLKSGNEYCHGTFPLPYMSGDDMGRGEPSIDCQQGTACSCKLYDDIGKLCLRCAIN